MNLKKTILISIITLLMLFLAAGLILKNRTQSQMNELFQMNKKLQEENYYMAEFEFKLLGLSYWLDKGHIYKALSKLNQLHHQLKTREGLIKMPEFKSKQEELEFYLNLQNPNTGAFMDASYPQNTQHEPTANVLLHLDALAEETGQPLKLKYPLKYLDKINTPEKLIATVNDWSTVGWIALKFPQTSFHNVRDLVSLARDSANYDESLVDMIYKHNLYNFSPEWRHALLQWVYDHQDPESGVWGPMSKRGKLLKKDISNSAPILKAFLDSDGNNIHDEFPFRYGNEFFSTVLSVLDKPHPKDDELAEWHEWGLETPKGLRTLTRYLWKYASQGNKAKAKVLIENYIKILFQKFYIPEEGAFSYYPYGEHATMDGARSGFKIFREIGALSGEKQKHLWGSPEENIVELGEFKAAGITKSGLDLITKKENVNSLRVYQGGSDYSDLTSGVAMIIYPQEPEVLDFMDLVHENMKWADTTSLTMGNWISKEEVIEDLDAIQFDEVPVYEKSLPLEEMTGIFQKKRKLVIIGFDIIQVPRYKIVYEYSDE